MAYYGLSNPWIAKYDVKTQSYSGGFKCGSAVGTDVTPQYNEAKLYGDNVLKESIKEFKYADVTLNVTELPIVAADAMFGHKVDTETNKITYNASDVANYVGYGFYASETIDGETTYIAAILPKVKFSESADSYATKGDSIEFKTPSLSGNALANESGDWKVKQTFKKEDEAIAFIKEYLGVTDTSTDTSVA